jgi:hypothetical protein
MPQRLTELSRRVLAHLPVWARDEKVHVEAEGGPDVSIRSYSRADFTVRLADDSSTRILDQAGASRSLNEAECEVSLRGLADQGLAVEKGGQWRMTRAGFATLHAPIEPGALVPGEVVVEANPAHTDSKAIGA